MHYNLTTMQSIFLNNKEVTLIKHNNKIVYQSSSGPDYTEPFYVENISNAAEILSIQKDYSDAPTLTIEYSTDKATWSTLGTTSTTALTYTLQPNDKLYLRCNTNAWYGGWNKNTINGVSKVGGNIMSLLYGSNFTGQETSFPSGSTYNFGNLFTNGYSVNVNLIDASELLLPATTLTEYCYFNMFYYCTSLLSAPVLPATTLADYCYDSMFSNCSSLTTAPALPATTMLRSCYSNMFFGCTSLTTAPVLPATTLANNCYYQMFYGCTVLDNVKCLATDLAVSNAFHNWLYNVSSTGTFTCAVGMSQIWSSGTDGIPEGWTVVEV